MASAVDYQGHQAPSQNVMSTEMAEDVMEASFARGLAAAECFEVCFMAFLAPCCSYCQVLICALAACACWQSCAASRAHIPAPLVVCIVSQLYVLE